MLLIHLFSSESLVKSSYSGSEPRLSPRKEVIFGHRERRRLLGWWGVKTWRRFFVYHVWLVIRNGRRVWFVIEEPRCWFEEINVVYFWLLNIEFVFKFINFLDFLFWRLYYWWVYLLQRIWLLYLYKLFQRLIVFIIKIMLLNFDLLDTWHDLFYFLLFLFQPQIFRRFNILF